MSVTVTQRFSSIGYNRPKKYTLQFHLFDAMTVKHTKGTKPGIILVCIWLTRSLTKARTKLCMCVKTGLTAVQTL